MLERKWESIEGPHRHVAPLSPNTSVALVATPQLLKASRPGGDFLTNNPTHQLNHHTHKSLSISNMSSDPRFVGLPRCRIWGPWPDDLHSKTTGTTQNTLGKVEETIGNVTGLDSWKTSGQERRVQGDTEYKQAQAQGYTEGTKDRLVGKKDQLAGAVTGDSTQEAGGMSSCFRSFEWT